ncbi:MAG TPA: pitrilysin family protein [Micropepsaceae bacterium]|jgi:predicted Zn-dependent peptidase
MSVEITRLPSGLIVATDPMPHLMSAALGVWVNCGARHETPAESGLSHMLEHMAFKGTATRTAKDIATEIEAVGGDINAYTSREQTAFHARVLKDDVGLALDMIADILIYSSFDEGELEREREVIIQEIGQTRDTPDDLIFDYLQEASYPDQPMGWPIFGSEKTVAGFSRGDLVSFMGRHYRAGAMMLIASGAVEHEAMVEAARRLFSPVAEGTERESLPAEFRGGDMRTLDDLEQAHLAFAFPGVASADPDAITAQVFATALGGGMSSRLFQEAREKRGLCYSIYAFSHSYRDTGTIGIYSGTAEDKCGEVAPLIAAEIEAMATGATEEEASRARAQLKASLLMGLESPHQRCELMAGHLYAYGRVLGLDEVIARVDAVDAGALRRFAERLCRTGNPAVAAVGPVKRLESRDDFARRFGRDLSLTGAN